MEWKLALQLTGVALGLLYLWLEYRADIRLWIVGLVMPIVHGVLYYRSGLYADCAMNGYYVLAGLYGLIVWRRTPRRKGAELRIAARRGGSPHPCGGLRRAARDDLPAARTLHQQYRPFWDSLTTALSIVAMWMLSRKYVEQWLVWLVVDVVTVGLYLYKGIPFTAGLYVLYAALAVAGYRRWLRQIG